MSLVPFSEWSLALGDLIPRPSLVKLNQTRYWWMKLQIIDVLYLVLYKLVFVRTVQNLAWNVSHLPPSVWHFRLVELDHFSLRQWKVSKYKLNLWKGSNTYCITQNKHDPATVWSPHGQIEHSLDISFRRTVHLSFIQWGRRIRFAQ